MQPALRSAMRLCHSLPVAQAFPSGSACSRGAYIHRMPLLAQVSAKAQCHGQLAVGSPLQLLKGAQTDIWHGNSSRQAYC